MHWTSAIESLCKAAEATSRKEVDARAEALDSALEAFYNALNAHAEVARDPSDRAVIATLNEWVYKPFSQALR